MSRWPASTNGDSRLSAQKKGQSHVRRGGVRLCISEGVEGGRKGGAARNAPIAAARLACPLRNPRAMLLGRTMMLLLLFTVSSALDVCEDTSVPPAPGSFSQALLSCDAYAGRCDSKELSTAQKASLLLHCPTTCAGTLYADGSTGYCPCSKGRDCCFDEPWDCDKRAHNTVVEHVMCRRTLGLCKVQEQRQQQSSAKEAPCSGADAETAAALKAAVASYESATAQTSIAAKAAATSTPLDPVNILHKARLLA